MNKTAPFYARSKLKQRRTKERKTDEEDLVYDNFYVKWHWVKLFYKKRDGRRFRGK